MKKLPVILFIIITGAPVIGKCQCAFKAPLNGKPRHDQYSESKKANIDKSKAAMAEQSDEFSKKKYQATVKGKSPIKRQKTVPLYM